MSKLSSEDRELSSVGEMHCLVHEAADLTAPSPSWKDRVHAAARAFGFQWERTKSFYYRTARRVDAGEMDVARRTIDRLRAEQRARRNTDHLLWLRAEAARLRGINPDRFGPHVDALEHVIRELGGEPGAMGVPRAPDGDAE